MHLRPLTFAVAVMVCSGPAFCQESAVSKAQEIKDTLLTLCMAGGLESSFTAHGDLELRAKIKDILTGKIGADAGGATVFTKQKWEGIIGGISKDMTVAQSEQATEARKCMVENGFPLIKQVLLQQ